MKKIIKSFTFWLILVALIEIIMHQIGHDSKNFVIIGLNPILNMIASTQGSLYEIVNSGPQIACNTITGQISIYWYFGSILTLGFYGAVIDSVRYCYPHFRKREVK